MEKDYLVSTLTAKFCGILSTDLALLSVLSIWHTLTVVTVVITVYGSDPAYLQY